MQEDAESRSALHVLCKILDVLHELFDLSANDAGYFRNVPRNALRIPRLVNRVPSFSPCQDSFNE